MSRIRFTADADLENAAGVVVEHYDAGSEHDLPIDKCRRWVRRGRAEFVSTGPPDAPASSQPEGVADAAPLDGSKDAPTSGASRDSGQERPSSASRQAPASPGQTSSTSGKSESKDAAGSSQSTGESSPKAAASSTLHLPTSSTPRTSRGGGRRRTPKGSKG